MKIYKYFGASYWRAVLGQPGQITLKCSFPKDFNDPYELFLTVDFTDEPEVLATYGEIIGVLPQVPTTCFSRSPSVVPMWAHYAESLQGFAIEFDEERLAAEFSGSGFGNVDYRDTPHEGVDEMLRRAHHVGKFRYVYLLQRLVFSSAYFTKASCWEYEQERRMLVPEEALRERDKILLLDVPYKCVTALVAGPRTSADVVAELRRAASQIGCPFLSSRIGRSTAVPFFVDAGDETHCFDGRGLAPVDSKCESCGEPMEKEGVECSWCGITEAHKAAAASGNSFRTLDRAGLLDLYLERMDEITRKLGKR